MSKVIVLTEKQNVVFEECKKFFIHNDAWPTKETLSAIGKFSMSTSTHYLNTFQEKGLLKLNAQEQFMLVRRHGKIVISDKVDFLTGAAPDLRFKQPAPLAKDTDDPLLDILKNFGSNQ